MSTLYIRKLFITSLLEIIGVILAFFIAYGLRSMRDWIPFVQLPVPYIGYEQFIPFVFFGVVLWIIVGLRGGLYSIKMHTPIIEEIRLVLTYSFFWFFIYIGFIYLSTGFIFEKEIPRLIILYTYIIATIISITIRIIVYTIYSILFKKNYLKKESILVISDGINDMKFDEKDNALYIYVTLKEDGVIENSIRDKTIASIIYLGDHIHIGDIFELAKIYGIPFMYPKVSPYTRHISSTSEYWIGSTPMIELSAIKITAWGRIIKRSFDIIVSSLLIIVSIPIGIIIAIGIWISDPSGPIIYKNRRIGQNGKIFALYKFRYMYWQYCTKEEYGISDGAMKYEEKLKQEKNTREGPLYKISDDPRKMPWGKWIEKLSLDELPQLLNVIKGDMSLIGPRPHQPREIELYDESDKQVLTVKPGITGMAQVYGRDKNSFKDEIMLDTYYIEHYSTFLDIAILLRTFLVVFGRIWSK